MDSVEAVETNLGKFVPLHLLQFDSDPQLQAAFRQLIEHNYEKGIVKSDIGLCEACGCQMSRKGMIHMKPSQRRTKKISKLLERQRNGSLFGKFNNFAVKKFLKSCTKLIVRCSSCQHVNKQALVSNELKQVIKHNIWQKALGSTEKDTEGDGQKKKRRKKKKTKFDVSSGLILPTPPHSSITDAHQVKPTQPEVSQPISSPPQTIGNISTKHQRSHQHKTISSQLRIPSTCSSTTPKKAVQTPQSQTPHSKRGAAPNDRSTSAKKTGMKQKGLKQFLEQGCDTNGTKRASLADFLSSL